MVGSEPEHSQEKRGLTKEKCFKGKEKNTENI